MNQVHRPSLKKFRSVEIFSKLSFSHLHNLVDALTDVTFADGEIIVRKDEVLSAFYIVNKGRVDVTYHENLDTDYLQEFQLPRASSEFAVKRSKLAASDDCGEDEPDFRSFGEWVLLKEPGPPMTAVAVGDVQCWTITRKRFEETVGSLRSIMMEDQHHTDKMSLLRKVQLAEVDEHAFEKITPKDLDWQETVYVTDYCEVGVVVCKKSGDVISMKRYQRRKVQRLGRENQVLLERDLFENLRPSPYVPHLLATPISSDSVALVLNCVLAGPLDSVLHSPLDEDSTRFVAASVVLAIELLHKDGVVYHGISPDILMLDRKGQVKLADFRFAEQMSDEQSFSICGMADFLAPEIIKGQGHGLASDWCLHITSAILLMRESLTGIGMNQQSSRLNVKVQLRLFNCLQHCP
jgi:serine/threonine protein kinase